MEGEKQIQPTELFQKYAEAIVSRSTDFITLRSPITKASPIEKNRPVPCTIDVQAKKLKIKFEPNVGDKEFPISDIEKIEWGNVNGNTGGIKFIHLTIKGDKPIVFHGQLDLMEMWYDQINMMRFNKPPETETAKAKIEVFNKAIQYSNQPFPDQALKVPPPPKDYNFVTKLNF